MILLLSAGSVEAPCFRWSQRCFSEHFTTLKNLTTAFVSYQNSVRHFSAFGMHHSTTLIPLSASVSRQRRGQIHTCLSDLTIFNFCYPSFCPLLFLHHIQPLSKTISFIIFSEIEIHFFFHVQIFQGIYVIRPLETYVIFLFMGRGLEFGKVDANSGQRFLNVLRYVHFHECMLTLSYYTAISETI